MNKKVVLLVMAFIVSTSIFSGLVGYYFGKTTDVEHLRIELDEDNTRFKRYIENELENMSTRIDNFFKTNFTFSDETKTMIGRIGWYSMWKGYDFVFNFIENDTNHRYSITVLGGRFGEEQEEIRNMKGENQLIELEYRENIYFDKYFVSYSIIP